MHGTFIRLSFYYHSIPFPSANSLCVSLALLRANDSIPDPIQASKKPLHLCTTSPSCTLLTSYLFSFCSSSGPHIRANCTFNSCTSTSWGVYVFFFFLLYSVSSPPSSAVLTFLLISFVSVAYICAAHILIIGAVIIVEGGLRAVMMFAKTPPDEEQ